MKNLEDLQYPIGKFEYGQKYSIAETRKHIRIIDRFPKELKKTLLKLRGGELEKQYRPGGWSVRQVVHHLADSHINAYIRMKLAVTETNPTIKPYDEKAWSETEDGKHGSVKLSLKMLAALHGRWIMFLESLSESDLSKTYYHPGSNRTMPMQEVIALYVWHGQHHLAHIKLVTDGKKSNKKTTKKVSDHYKKLDHSSSIVTLEPKDDSKKNAVKTKPPKSPKPAPAPKTPKVKAESAADAPSTEPKKLGRKPKANADGTPKPPKVPKSTPAPKTPKVKAESAADVSSTEPKKLGRKPKTNADGTPKPPKSPKPAPAPKTPKVKAASAADAPSTEPKKRGPKPKTNADGTPKVKVVKEKKPRTPMTDEQKQVLRERLANARLAKGKKDN